MTKAQRSTRLREHLMFWLIAVVLVTAAACSQKSREPFRDAAVKGHDDSPARIINMPDGFSNVAAKCDGPNMVYTAYKGDANRSAVSVVANDPRCRG